MSCPRDLLLQRKLRVQPKLLILRVQINPLAELPNDVAAPLGRAEDQVRRWNGKHGARRGPVGRVDLQRKSLQVTVRENSAAGCRGTAEYSPEERGESRSRMRGIDRGRRGGTPQKGSRELPPRWSESRSCPPRADLAASPSAGNGNTQHLSPLLLIAARRRRRRRPVEGERPGAARV